MQKSPNAGYQDSWCNFRYNLDVKVGNAREASRLTIDGHGVQADQGKDSWFRIDTERICFGGDGYSGGGSAEAGLSGSVPIALFFQVELT